MRLLPGREVRSLSSSDTDRHQPQTLLFSSTGQGFLLSISIRQSGSCLLLHLVFRNPTSFREPLTILSLIRCRDSQNTSGSLSSLAAVMLNPLSLEDVYLPLLLSVLGLAVTLGTNTEEHAETVEDKHDSLPWREPAPLRDVCWHRGSPWHRFLIMPLLSESRADDGGY